MTAKLQPPIGPRVDVRWRIAKPEDPRRLRRIAEILADILDNGTTPEEGRRS